MELPDFLSRGTTGEIRATGHRIDLYLLVGKHDEGIRSRCCTKNIPPWSKVEKFHAGHQSGPGVLRVRKIIEERASVTEKT